MRLVFSLFGISFFATVAGLIGYLLVESYFFGASFTAFGTAIRWSWITGIGSTAITAVLLSMFFSWARRYQLPGPQRDSFPYQNDFTDGPFFRPAGEKA